MADRNPSIELLRILLMFGICLLHVVAQGSHPSRLLVNLLSPCVCGFVFISGWFGVRFSITKILRLQGIALYAAFLCAAIHQGLAGDASARTYFELAAKMWKHFWFLHAYVVMMCFAPAVNFIVENARMRQALAICAPIIAFSCVWSWIAGMPVFGRLFPKPSGIGAYSGFTLLAIYAVARLCRNYLPTLPRNCMIVCFAVSILGVLLLGGDYHSPFAIVLAACVFYLFCALPPPCLWGVRTATLISPSLFSVYLLHSHGHVGFPLIHRLESFASGHMPIALGYVVCAFIVFVVCVAADIPRRLFAYCILKDKGGKGFG